MSPSKSSSQSATDPDPPERAEGPPSGLLTAAGLAAIVFVSATLLTGWFGAANRVDRILSAAEQAARTATFAAAGPLLLPPVLPQDHQAALQTMQLPAGQLQELQQRTSELVWLTLWDDVAEDGDAITVISDGYRQTVQITHEPFRVALPKPSNGQVQILGVTDGGGGITVAVSGRAGQLPVPVMTVGQTIAVPVR